MTHWSEQLWLWLVDDLIRKSGNETYSSNQNGTQPIETAHGLPVPLHHRQHFTYYYLANASNSSYQQPQILIEWTLVNLSNPGHSRQLNLLVCPSVSCKLISVLYLFAIRHCLLASLLLLLAYIAIVALIFLSIRACCQLYTNHRQRNNQQQPRAHHIQPGKSRSSHSGSQLLVVCSCQHRPPIEQPPNSAQRRIKLLAPDKLEQQYQDQDQVDPTLIPKECTDGYFVPADGSMQLVDVSQASNHGPSSSRSLVPMQQQCASSGTNAPLIPLTAALQTTAPIVVAFNQVDRSGSRSRDHSTYYDPVSVAYPRFPPTATAGPMPVAITDNNGQSNSNQRQQPAQQGLQPMSSPEPSDTGGGGGGGNTNGQDIPNISLMPAEEFISYCDYQNEHRQSSSEFGRYRPASSSSDSTLVMADCRSMQTAAGPDLLRTINRKVSNRITTTL